MVCIEAVGQLFAELLSNRTNKSLSLISCLNLPDAFVLSSWVSINEDGELCQN